MGCKMWTLARNRWSFAKSFPGLIVVWRINLHLAEVPVDSHWKSLFCRLVFCNLNSFDILSLLRNLIKNFLNTEKAITLGYKQRKKLYLIKCFQTYMSHNFYFDNLLSIYMSSWVSNFSFCFKSRWSYALACL